MKNTRKSVERAEASAALAKAKYHQAVVDAFSLGSRVKVTHYHGSFFGVVVLYYYDPGYLQIRNDKSGKVSKRFYRDVEVMA